MGNDVNLTRCAYFLNGLVVQNHQNYYFFVKKKYESKISISNTLYGSEFLSNLGVKEDAFSGYGFQRYAVGVFRMIQDSQALFLHVTFFPAE